MQDSKRIESAPSKHTVVELELGALRINGNRSNTGTARDIEAGGNGEAAGGRGAINRHRGSRGRNYTPKASTSQLPPTKVPPLAVPIVGIRIPYRPPVTSGGAEVMRNPVSESSQGKTTNGSAATSDPAPKSLSSSSPTATTSLISSTSSSPPKTLTEPIFERPPTRLSLRHLPHLILCVTLPSEYPLETGPTSISIEVADGVKMGSWLSEEHKVMLAVKLSEGKSQEIFSVCHVDVDADKTWLDNPTSLGWNGMPLEYDRFASRGVTRRNLGTEISYRTPAKLVKISSQMAQ